MSLLTIAIDLLRVTRELTGPAPRKLADAARTLIASLTLADGIEQQSLKLRLRELERGTATRLRSEALLAAQACQDLAEIQARQDGILAPLRSAPRDVDRVVYRVALPGDVYSISEPFLNMNLEQKLGYLGVEADRWLWLSKTIRFPSLDRLLRRGEPLARDIETSKYLAHDAGGFTLPSVKGAVDSVRGGVDGRIHLAPFNCVPETVAVSVLPRLARDYDVPMLALSYDEQSGQAGLSTRLEAFVDLLERRGRQ